jgi:GNAT superfamily N-acetyltransferase
MTDQVQAPMVFSRDDIVLRTVREADRAQIEAIAAQVWEGRDYLPLVFDDWLADEDGGFIVLTVQERVVGVGKLTYFGDGEWWMEGLRIDPAYRNKGLARILHHYLVSQARQGEGVLRFATGQKNEPVLKLADETGFQLVGRYVHYQADAEPVDNPGWWQLDTEDFPRLRQWLDNSDYLADADNSFERWWIWRFASDDFVKELLAAGLIYGWHSNGQQDELQGVFVVNPERQYMAPPPDSFIELAFVDAEPEQRVKLWRTLSGFAHAEGVDYVRFKLLDDACYIGPAEAGGWYNRREGSFGVLFSRPLTLTQDVDVRFDELPAIDQ